MPTRADLTEEQGRAFLGLREGEEVPPAEELMSAVRAIVQTNLAVDREIAAKGLMISPLWEERGGASVVRAVALPAPFRERYFDGEGRRTLSLDGVLQNVVDLVPWMASDPVGGAIALSDVHRLWFEEEAPAREVATGHDGFRTLLSLLLADVARKGSAGLSALEYMLSLGIPIDEVHDPDEDPPVDEIKASMKERIRDMWAEEERWMRDAL